MSIFPLPVVLYFQHYLQNDRSVVIHLHLKRMDTLYFIDVRIHAPLHMIASLYLLHKNWCLVTDLSSHAMNGKIDIAWLPAAPRAEQNLLLLS